MPGARRDVARPPGLFPGVPYDYDALAPSMPPSALLGVAALGYPDQLVEIEAVALTS